MRNSRLKENSIYKTQDAPQVQINPILADMEKQKRLAEFSNRVRLKNLEAIKPIRTPGQFDDDL